MIDAILVPYDLDQFRRGAGLGPEALLASGVLRELDIAGSTTVEITAATSSQIQHCIAVDAAIAAAVQRSAAAGRVPVVLAGNCHSCLGTLSGLGTRASIIWFDAHGDLNTPDTTETGYFDGMALSTALGWGWQALTRQIPGFNAASDAHVVLAGGRDLDGGERGLLERSRIAHHWPPSGSDRVSAEFAAALAEPSRPRQAYVHLDLDVIDPADLRANRFGVPGGVSTAWLEEALRTVRQRHHVAAVGVTAYDPSYAAPAAAAPIVNRLLRALLHTDS